MFVSLSVHVHVGVWVRWGTELRACGCLVGEDVRVCCGMVVRSHISPSPCLVLQSGRSPMPSSVSPSCGALLASQFEHTIVITKDGCEVLTARLPSSRPLWWETPSTAEAQA